MRRLRGGLRIGIRVAIRVATAAAIVLFAMLAALPLFQHKLLIVTSGSMEPVLSAGDAAVIRIVSAEQLVQGDVITYRGYSSDRLTTHRIVQPVMLGSGLHFQTQGDANTAPDPDLAPATGVVGRYVVGIPYGGRAVGLLSHPHARLGIIGLPALATLVAELRSLLGRRAGTGAVGGSRYRDAAIVGLAGLAAISLAVLASGAVMTDVDAAPSNTFTTAIVFPG